MAGCIGQALGRTSPSFTSEPKADGLMELPKAAGCARMGSQTWEGARRKSGADIWSPGRRNGES